MYGLWVMGMGMDGYGKTWGGEATKERPNVVTVAAEVKNWEKFTTGYKLDK